MKIQYVFGNPAKAKSTSKGGTMAAKKKRKGTRKVAKNKVAKRKVKTGVKKVAKRKTGVKKVAKRKAKRKPSLNASLHKVGIKTYVKLGKRAGVIVSKGTKNLTAKQRARLKDYHLGKKSGKGIVVLRNPKRRRNPDGATIFMGQPYNPMDIAAANASAGYQSKVKKPRAVKLGKNGKPVKRKLSKKQLAARKKRQQTIAKGVRLGLAPRQTISKKRKKPLPVVRKGGIFQATSKKGSVLMKRKNPGFAGNFVDASAPTIGVGTMFDTGHTKNELIAVVGAGLAAPFISALAARIPAIQKIQAIPDFGVPALLVLVGGVVAAKMQNPTYKNAGKALVAVGAITLGGNLAKKFTASKGGVKGMMDGMLGIDGYEGYDGDSVGEYGDVGSDDEIDLSGDDSQLAALPAGLQGVDFTPSHNVRPFGEVPHGYAGSQMAGVDFTPRSQVRPFSGMGDMGDMGRMSRDGADFGSPRDGADFGSAAGMA